MRALWAGGRMKEVTYPQCALKGQYQKWTTLWYDHNMNEILEGRRACAWQHCTHKEVARGLVGDRTGWKSAKAAAYPHQMNQVLAKACKLFTDKQETNYFKLQVPMKWKINPNGNLIPSEAETHQEESLIGAEQVHVWTQWNLPHSKEEREWKERNQEGVPPPLQWCDGPVVDFDFLDGKRKNSTGAVNLGDWEWNYGITDRERDSVGMASADTYHLNAIQLSHLFDTPRTFDIESLSHTDGRLHTTWADLLEGTEPNGGDKEWVVSRIIDHRNQGAQTITYKVRWYGHGAEMDTWETINCVKDTRAWRRYVGQEKRARTRNLVGTKTNKGSDTQARGENPLCGAPRPARFREVLELLFSEIHQIFVCSS